MFDFNFVVNTQATNFFFLTYEVRNHQVVYYLFYLLLSYVSFAAVEMFENTTCLEKY